MSRYFTMLLIAYFSIACGGSGGGETTTPPADTTAPSVPSNLVATVITESSVSLSWAPSSDNVGVTEYDIFTNGNFLSTTPNTETELINLARSTTYSLQVRARDAAGNNSALSVPLVITTADSRQIANGFLTTISTSNNNLIADGISTVQITVQAIDEDGVNLNVGGDQVNLVSTAGSLDTITDNSDGTYTATLTSSTAQEVAIITGTINSETINDYAGVSFKVDQNTAEFIALAALGEQIYEDTNLSEPTGQSCASCHDRTTSFIDPDSDQSTSLGADDIRVGKRNSQTVSYAAHIPQIQAIEVSLPRLIGGQFWDGRASTLEEQAKQPFLNPDEMNNLDEAAVINKIKLANYRNDFEAIFGVSSLDDVSAAYDQMALAIAAFERSQLFSPFTSKFDDEARGTYTFTDSEQRGRDLFFGQLNCDRCHSTPIDLGEQMFSNFEYFNIGVPANDALIAARGSFIDIGLGEQTNATTDNGKFRTPSLRNIANTAPYMHNGVFTTLREVIDFYNADLGGSPEVNENLDSGGQYLFGGLTPSDKDDLEAFLNTFTDQ